MRAGSRDALSTVAEQAMSRALEQVANSRAEFSTDIGPALRALRQAVDDLTLAEVQRARERRGNSWTEVGTGLGMTRQGAKRKFGDRVA